MRLSFNLYNGLFLFKIVDKFGFYILEYTHKLIPKLKGAPDSKGKNKNYKVLPYYVFVSLSIGRDFFIGAF